MTNTAIGVILVLSGGELYSSLPGVRQSLRHIDKQGTAFPYTERWYTMTKAQRIGFLAVQDAIDDLECLIGEMQEEFDDKSEKWQESQKGVDTQATINSLEDYLNELQNVTQPDLE